MLVARSASERAVVARINRHLAHHGNRLRRLRGGVANRSFTDLGEWYTIDVARNFTARTHVDIGALAAELGVIAPGERLG